MNKEKSTERVKARRERLRSAGLIPKEIWVNPKNKEQLKALHRLDQSKSERFK